MLMTRVATTIAALFIVCAAFSQNVTLKGEAIGIDQGSLNLAVRIIDVNDTLLVQETNGISGSSDEFQLKFRSEGNYEVLFTATPDGSEQTVEKSFFVLINQNTPKKTKIDLSLDFQRRLLSSSHFVLWDEEGHILQDVSSDQYASALK